MVPNQQHYDALESLRKLEIENKRLRDAIRRYGLSIMAAGENWSLHDRSEYGKAEEEKTLAVATENVALTVAMAQIKDFAAAHHADQPAHVLLHSLTVDIPAMCDATATDVEATKAR